MSDMAIQIPELFTLEDAIKWYALCMRVSEREAREEASRIIRHAEQNEHVDRALAINTFIEDTQEMTPDDYDAIEQSAKESGLTKHQAKTFNAVKKQYTRGRKIDADKRTIIDALALCVNNYDGNVNIADPEREIVFTYNGNEYKITLSKSRKKKD